MSKILRIHNSWMTKVDIEMHEKNRTCFTLMKIAEITDYDKNLAYVLGSSSLVMVKIKKVKTVFLALPSAGTSDIID